MSTPPSPPSPPVVAPKRLRTDVVLMLGNKGTVLVSGILLSIVVARALGPSGRGTLAVALSLNLILVQIGSFGFQTANPYFTTGGRASIGTVVVNSLWLSAIFGGALTGLAALAKVVVPSVVSGLDWAALLLAASGVPAALCMIYLQGVLLGEGRTVAYNCVEAGASVFSLVAIVVVDLAFGLTVERAVGVVSASSWLAAIAFFVMLRSHVGGRRRLEAQLVRAMAGYAMRLYVTSLLAYIVIRIDVLMVNAYLGSEQAGYYSLAVALNDMLYILPTVIAMNIFPRAIKGQSIEETAQIFRASALVFGLVVAATAILAEPLVRILYGADFVDAAGLFWYLAPGSFAIGVMNIISYHYAADGFPLELMLFWALGLLVNVAINAVWLPGGPTYVASLSSTIAYGLLLGLHARKFVRDLGSWRAILPRPAETWRMVRTAVRPAA